MILKTQLPSLTSVIESLKQTNLQPSPTVNKLFGALVEYALQEDLDLNSVDLAELHELCATGESNLETFWAQQIVKSERPQAVLAAFPYWQNYQDLAQAEIDCMSTHVKNQAKMLFIGCGPLPLSAVLFAQEPMFAQVEAIDADMLAVASAKKVCTVLQSPVKITHQAAESFNFRDVDVVFVAALVGMTSVQKQAILEDIRLSARPGTLVAVRSATGSRELLYPKLQSLPPGFTEVACFVPHSQVINTLHVLKIKEHHD